jgi:hypothetical protein
MIPGRLEADSADISRTAGGQWHSRLTYQRLEPGLGATSQVESDRCGDRGGEHHPKQNVQQPPLD